MDADTDRAAETINAIRWSEAEVDTLRLDVTIQLPFEVWKQ